MTSDEVFAAAVAVVLEHEGGFVDHPSDPGGATHWGISKRSYPELDIPNLTRDDAVAIYRRDFWPYVPPLTPAAQVVALDVAVNHGPGRLRTWLDEGHTTAAALTARRLEYYTGLSTWEHFGRGWTRRAGRTLAAAERLEGNHA